MPRTVNAPASDWQTNGRSHGGFRGLGQTLRDRIRQGNVPDSIQEIIGPIEEKDIDLVIDILETLKGEGTRFEDLTPQEKRAFAQAYLNRTGGRRERLGGGVFVLGALAVVGGLVWWQSTQGRRMQEPPTPPGRENPDGEDAESDDT